ncbi:hypothetical protein DFH06DRAFT_1093051 [Mycena polygramma]|nr:hypothetical protein DFH06DRAFT_1093051 [Mycena polygramma]
MSSNTDYPTCTDPLQVLRDSLVAQVPYTGGIYPVKAEDLVIYYGVETASRIDLGNATTEELVALAAACDQATFGKEQKDVLDETYRKAGKMDLDKFAARLDAVGSGLIDAISPDLLQGQDTDGEKALRAELYKLNVYGPGSFFKAHKDTPRGETMIGSLVLIFPTEHTGGALTLEHGGVTWTFDSAAELSAAGSVPGVAYVAFYSDVTHAVEPVHTGHRVTLTYNLFVVDRSAGSTASRVIPGSERAFENALRQLLADPSFLSSGGFLAYGLSHQYPMPIPPPTVYSIGPQEPRRSPLAPVLQLLKGNDARVRTISQRVGLATHVKILYNSGQASYDVHGQDVLVDEVPNTDNMNESCMDMETAIERMGVVLDDTDVHWVTRITDLNRVQSSYMAYGNESSLGHIYGNAALFVYVPAFGQGIRC